MIWPHDDTDSLVAFYGDPRLPGFENKYLDLVVAPWGMRVQIHKKCAESLEAVFEDIWQAVGEDASKLPPGATKFDGSYNFRPIRGSTRLSCHAFGAAIDLDADHNGMNTRGDKGTMSPIVIAAFKRQGWCWGGDWIHRQDPMHFQAAHEGKTTAPPIATTKHSDPFEAAAQAAEKEDK